MPGGMNKCKSGLDTTKASTIEPTVTLAKYFLRVIQLPVKPSAYKLGNSASFSTVFEIDPVRYRYAIEHSYTV